MSRFHMSKNNKKKTIVLVCMLGMLVCLGVVNNRLTDKELDVSSEYVNFEQQQMDEHDGEVLVDSINLAAVPGTGGSADETEATAATTDTAIVITSDDLSELTNVNTYLDEIRATIDMDRNEIISMLTDVIAEAKDGPEKNNATAQKLKIIEYMNAEKVMESLIENKGFTDALVIMTDTSVNVTVNKQDLTQSDVAKIMDIVIRETNRDAGQIVIQSKF